MNQSDRYLCFNLGREEFAIPLLTVKEVIGMPELTPIPQMPSHFLGMMNLRGNVITVMDLRLKVGIKPQPSEEQTVVILEMGELNLGCLVDCVNSVLSLSEDQILPRPHMEANRASQSITGVIKKEEKLILLMDINKALSIEEKNFVQQKNQSA